MSSDASVVSSFVVAVRWRLIMNNGLGDNRRSVRESACESVDGACQKLVYL